MRSWPRTVPLAVLVLLLAVASAFADSEPPPCKLVDQQGNPQAGVQVSVIGRTGAVTTDRDGRFRLIPEPAPPFQLAVFDERGALLGMIKVDSLDVRELVVSPATQDSVTVIGGAAPSTSAPPAAAASVFSSVERQETGPERLVHALAETPGAGRVGSGAPAVPSIRGLARGRILILLDDGRVTTERRAGPSATYLDPFSLESIEIIRGPGSVEYGSDAMGGIIHARTPLPSADETSLRYELTAGVGVETASAAFEINQPVGSSAILGQAYTRNNGDYVSPEGVVENSSSRGHGALLRGLVPTASARLQFGLQLDRGRDIGKPAATSDVARTVYPIEDSNRFTFATDFPGLSGFQPFELRTFLGSYRLVTDRERLAGPGGPGTLERSDVDANDASVRLVGGRPIGQTPLRFGLEIASRFDLHAVNSAFDRLPDGSLIGTTEQVSIGDARRVAYGLFAGVEQRLSKLPGSFAAGLRGDLIETHNTGGTFGDRSTSNSAPAGYLALTWQPPKDWSVTLQYARGFRDPQLSDRYFVGVTGRGTIIGNPDLDPETSNQFDLAVHKTVGRARIAGFAYFYRIDDLVERFEIPGMVDVFTWRNRGAAEYRGLELETDVALPLDLGLRVGLNYARGTTLDDDSFAPDVPPPSLRVSLRRRVALKYWWRVDYYLQARDDEPGPTERETPGYAVLDASAGFPLSTRLEARVYLRNLTDKAYPASSDADAPPAPGLNLAFVLAGRY